jgi:hypothetical protein
MKTSDTTRLEEGGICVLALRATSSFFVNILTPGRGVLHLVALLAVLADCNLDNRWCFIGPFGSQKTQKHRDLAAGSCSSKARRSRSSHRQEQ